MKLINYSLISSMKSFQLIFIYCTILYNVLYSQANYSKSIDINREYNEAIAVREISDGYVVLSGSYCNNDAIECTDIIKLDYKGNIIWKNQINLFPNTNKPADVYGNHGFAGEDKYKNLYFGGIVYNSSTNFDYFVLKLDYYGNIVWLKYYGSNFIDNSSTILFNTDSTLVLFGDQGTGINIYDKIEIIKIDLDGNILSKYLYGPENSIVERADIVLCKNSDMLFSYVTCKNQPCFFNQDKILKLIRINSAGEIVWEQDVIEFEDTWSHNCIVELPNGGFALSFNRLDINANFTYPPILIWLDSMGNTNNLTEFDSDFERNIRDLTVNDEGMVLGCGYIDRLQNGIKGWIFAINYSYEIIWEREILDAKSPYQIMQLNALTHLNDKSIISVGFILDTVILNSNIFPDKDIWILKSDKFGCLMQDCDSMEMVTKILGNNQENDNILIYPVPADNYITIHSENTINSNLEIKLTNLATGKIVILNTLESISNNMIYIPTSNYENGVYMIELYVTDGYIINKLISIIH